MLRLDPLVARTRRRATVILTYTDEALEGIPARHRGKARSIVHIGVSDSDVVVDDANVDTATPFTVVSGGRLVHWKGLDLLIEGFADFVRATGDADARLVFTGSGPYRPYLEALVARHGLAAQVAFLGHLPSRDDVYRAVTSADLYALPTLRDGPPVAILEAMLAARPVLCLDLGATRELVPDDAGFKIRFADRGEHHPRHRLRSRVGCGPPRRAPRDGARGTPTRADEARLAANWRRGRIHLPRDRGAVIARRTRHTGGVRTGR